MIPRHLFDAIPEAVIFFDNLGRITDANAQADELFGGHPAEGLRGGRIDDLIPGLHAASTANPTADRQAEPAAAQQVSLLLVGQPRTGAPFPADVLVGGGGSAGSIRAASVRRRGPAGGTGEDRSADRLLRKMTEAVGIGLGLRQLDPPEYLYTNPAIREILGSEPALIWPKGPPQAGNSEKADSSVGLSVGGGGGGTAEVQVELANGGNRWLRLTSTPIVGDDGEVGQLAMALEDITSLKEIEGSLRDSEQRFRQMAGSVAVGFSLRELGTGGFSYVSPGFRRIFALDPSRSAPSLAEVTSRIHQGDLGMAATATAKVEAGESVRAELRIRRPAPPGDIGADLRWVEFCSSPVTDEHGAVVRVAATVEDITERKAAETALRMSEQRFRRIAGALQIGVSLRQLNPTKFLYVNRKYIDIVGADPTRATPTEIEAAQRRIHPADQTGVMADYWRRSNAGLSAWAEMRIIEPSGETKWMRLTSHPIEVNDGDTPMAAGSIEDITAAKAAEAALDAARREADSANLAKSDFLSRMSHELRTPLNAVLGFAQILELDLASDTQLDAVRHILGGGRHLLAMINDLLDISRIETDQLELSFEPVAISEIVLESVGLLGPQAADHGVVVRFDQAQPLAAGFVLADRRRLRQVVLNLLSNAIKYNRAGRVDIRCGMADETFFTLAVTDSGIGIRPDQLHRLFNPFDRLGQQATDIDGAGIGLALSHRLIEQMGGRLEVESTWGTGSTFTVVIPLATAPGPLIANDLGAADEDGPLGVTTATLLYVEDNRSNVDLMARIVGRRPAWTLVHAADGAAGLQLAPGLLPDLIFLDLHLSDSDGIDLLRAIRADPDTAGIPLVVVSADASAGQIHRLHTAGADDYLTKPFDVAEILRLLDHHYPIGRDAPTPPVGPPIRVA